MTTTHKQGTHGLDWWDSNWMRLDLEAAPLWHVQETNTPTVNFMSVDNDTNSILFPFTHEKAVHYSSESLFKYGLPFVGQWSALAFGIDPPACLATLMCLAHFWKAHFEIGYELTFAMHRQYGKPFYITSQANACSILSFIFIWYAGYETSLQSVPTYIKIDFLDDSN